MTARNIRRFLLSAAVAAYVFLAAAWLYRAPNTPVTDIMGSWLMQAFGLTILFAPLCVIGAALRMGLRALFVWYIALVYIAILGGTSMGSNELTFSAPGTPITLENLVFNSAIYLLLLGTLNFVPTSLTYGLSVALWSSARRRFQGRAVLVEHEQTSDFERAHESQEWPT